MSDLDILVPTRQASPAIALLRELDWTPELRSESSLSRFLSVRHTEFVSSGPKRLSLICTGTCSTSAFAPESDADFWDGTLRIQVDGVQNKRAQSG